MQKPLPCRYQSDTEIDQVAVRKGEHYGEQNVGHVVEQNWQMHPGLRVTEHHQRYEGHAQYRYD